MTTSAVLLDVDGTLIDTNLLHVLAWSRALRRLGREVDATKLLRAIGMGGDRLVPAMLGDVDDASAENARRMHAEEFVDKGLIRHAEPLPGAVDLLRALRAHGVSIALASSAKRQELDTYLAMLGGEGMVDAWVTKDDVEASKPSPDIFAAALEKLDHPARALVIGDTAHDVRAASAVGLACITVLTGGLTRDLLLEAGAAAVYENVAELARGLDGALSRLRPPSM